MPRAMKIRVLDDVLRYLKSIDANSTDLERYNIGLKDLHTGKISRAPRLFDRKWILEHHGPGQYEIVYKSLNRDGSWIGCSSKAISISEEEDGIVDPVPLTGLPLSLDGAAPIIGEGLSGHVKTTVGCVADNPDTEELIARLKEREEQYSEATKRIKELEGQLKELEEDRDWWRKKCLHPEHNQESAVAKAKPYKPGPVIECQGDYID